MIVNLEDTNEVAYSEEGVYTIKIENVAAVGVILLGICDCNNILCIRDLAWEYNG